MTVQVVGMGALNVDSLYRVRRIVTDGEEVVQDFATVPGGSAANTVYGLAKLGIKTGFFGACGDDSGGDLLLNSFRSVGTDISQTHVLYGQRTGSVLCLSDKTRRALYVMSGANRLLKLDSSDLTFFNEAELVHCTSFADKAQFDLQIDIVSHLEKRVKLSFSPGTLYAKKKLHALIPLLRRTHVLFANHQELELMTGKDYIPGAHECLEAGCKLVVVTLGSGQRLETGKRVVAYIVSPGGTSLIEPVTDSAERSLETTGAGDAFAAGFLYGLLKGKTETECGLLGALVASFAIKKVGARAGLPTLPQLLKVYTNRFGVNL